MSTDVRVAVIGTGNWGRRHIRVLAQIPGCRVTHLVDPNPDNLAQARAIAAGAEVLDDHRQFAGRPCDAAVIASPADTHFAIARDCLESGRHVLVEKPLALRSREAEQLRALARESDLRLMVGHILLFHPALQALHEYLQTGAGGAARGITTCRTDPGPARNHEDALRAFAVHDIAAAVWLLNDRPESARATGDLRAGLVRFDLRFPGDIEMQGQAGWHSGTRARRLDVFLERGGLRFDDTEPFTKLRSLDGTGAERVPEFASDEPLRRECEHFLESIRLGRAPHTDAEHGLAVVRIVNALDESLARGGARVPVDRG